MDKFDTKRYFKLIAELSMGFTTNNSYQKALDILHECYKHSGVVFTMGCGGSASTATHFAADLAKTVSAERGFKAISLVDDIPLVSAWTNDFGWESVFEGQLKPWLTKSDVLVGFSVHGGNKQWSGNLTKAMQYARKVGAKIIGFSGFDGGAMKELADACLIVKTDSEIYGTPLVEAMHVVLHHALIFDLKERIK
jgi:D-sedoheptulose 7-phosphate isomerase